MRQLQRGGSAVLSVSPLIRSCKQIIAISVSGVGARAPRLLIEYGRARAAAVHAGASSCHIIVHSCMRRNLAAMLRAGLARGRAQVGEPCGLHAAGTRAQPAGAVCKGIWREEQHSNEVVPG